jgi:transposase
MADRGPSYADRRLSWDGAEVFESVYGEPEPDARRCPRCGFYNGLNYVAVRSTPGIADFGWRCPSCGHEWGFEVLGDE